MERDKEKIAAMVNSLAQEIADREAVQLVEAAIKEAVQLVLAELLYLYKNREYESEQEMRLLAVWPLTEHTVSSGAHSGPIQMDERCRLYVETPAFLFDRSGYELVIGPTAVDYSTARLSLLYLLRKQKVPEGYVTVSRSKVPYKQ